MRFDKPLLHALLLTLVAGIADAVGYITMGGVFAANMTGNTVLAGIAAAEGAYALAGQRLAPLVTFFIGAMVARLLLRLVRKPQAPLLLEAAILAAVGFLPLDRDSAVLIVAAAMGLQASALTHFGDSAVSTVVVTSTLARIADATLDRVWPIARHHKPPPAATSRLLAITWIGYLGGAMAGTALLAVIPWPLLVPAALLVIVVTTL